MRHNRDDKRFSRTSSHLRCMLANMTNDLISHGRIKTTTQKAKVLRRYAERMITLGKRGTVHARRQAMAFMRSKTAVTRLFDEIAPRFTSRNGGYTRIMKLGVRAGDAADLSIIELVEGVGEEAPAKKPAKKKAPAKKAPAKKAAPKKAAEKKSEGEGEKKPAARKTTAPKKTTATKSAAKKAAPKKAAPKKTAAKKTGDG